MTESPVIVTDCVMQGKYLPADLVKEAGDSPPLLDIMHVLRLGFFGGWVNVME